MACHFNLFQSLENFDELRTARTPWYSSPSLGVLPSPTNLSCELRVSKPDYTSNIGRASQLDGIIEGTSSFWDRFRYISIIASTVNNKNYSLIKTKALTILRSAWHPRIILNNTNQSFGPILSSKSSAALICGPARFLESSVSQLLLESPLLTLEIHGTSLSLLIVALYVWCISVRLHVLGWCWGIRFQVLGCMYKVECIRLLALC